MHTIPTSQLMSFLEFVAVTRREPVLIWGSFGVGKSNIVQQLSRKLGAQLVDVRLGQWDSVDLRGLPDRDGDWTKWLAPKTLPFKGNPLFSSEGIIFLFLDELNGAPLAVQGAAYQLINDRAVGEHELMDNVVIIAAANRESDKGATNRMALPLLNRFTQVEVIPEADAVCAHFQSIGLPAEGIAFLQFRKTLLHTYDPAKPEKVTATPRTWEKALRYFADTTVSESVKLAAMAGAIGEGPASEFWGFTKIWQSITPLSAILADPEGVELPGELSLTWATAINVSGAMAKKNVSKLHKYLCRLDPEYVIAAWQLAVKRDEDLFGTKEFIDFSKRFKVVFD